MSALELDVIVPVHDAHRRVDRLAASVLDGTGTPLRLTFVCHGIPVADIRAAVGEHADDPRVRFIGFSDGIRSPTGPFRAGLAAATAPYVMKIDSDDALEPGALDAWMRLRRRAGAAIVICRMRSATATQDWPTPPSRPLRRHRMSPLRDRLSYRTSTMGIIARDLMLQSPPVVGLPTGEDIESGLGLWFSGRPIALASREPAYLVHDDAGERATSPRPVADEFAWLPSLTESPLIASLDTRARATIATKLVRVQLFGALTARAASLSAEDIAMLRDAASMLVRLADGVPPWLSRADRDVLDALTDPSADTASLAPLLARRRQFGHPATLLPRQLRWTLHRESPLRVMTASLLAARRRTRVRR